MPDVTDFQIVRLANASLTVPRWQVSGKIVSDPAGVWGGTGAPPVQPVLKDFTGANAVVFPAILGQLPAVRQDEIVAGWIIGLIKERFGV